MSNDGDAAWPAARKWSSWQIRVSGCKGTQGSKWMTTRDETRHLSSFGRELHEIERFGGAEGERSEDEAPSTGRPRDR